MVLSTFKLFKNQEGYVILSNEQLKAYQKIIAKIMDDIVKVCKDNEIRAILAYGSALGAIRHDGFIPWDDDIDIYMFRADYEKFLRLFKKQYGKKYWIHTPEETPGYLALLPKVLLKGTVVRQFEDHENNECGAFIDIFILENEFNNKILALVHAAGCYIFAGLVSCRRMYRDSTFLLAIVNDKNLKKAIKIKSFLGRLSSFIPADMLTHLAERWYKLCKNDTSKRVIVPCVAKELGGDFYERAWFEGQRMHLFEGREWEIPKEAEKYLKRIYGDYMKIPTKAEQEKHTFLEFKI